MSSDAGPEYGRSSAWQPERPRWRVFPLLVSWFATGIALMVAAGILPGVDIESFWGALVVAAIIGALNAVIPPALAALRLPLTLVLGFLVVLIADALMLLAAAELTDGVLTVDNFGWALLAALIVAAVSVVLAVLLGSDDMGSIRIAQRIAKRQGIIASTDVPGIVYLEIDGLALPVLRRAMRDGNAPNMARWARHTHRLAEWETDLSSQTGASQAGILLGSNEDISAFRWVEKETATMMTCSAPRRLRRARAPARDGHRTPRRRRREPWQPPLRRGRGRDPHRQPDGRGEKGESRLSGVLRERRKRAAHARPFRLGGHPRVGCSAPRDPPGRAAARPPWRHLPADAGRALRLRARPDRVGRPHRHHARATCRLCDLLELRRGRAPLGPRACRHPRGAAQARRPLRPHRACVPVRAPAVRDRRPLRPRADAGGDLQAAERLRPRRARRALTRTW